MIKVYALNKNGKIELTLEELQKLLDEAEAEGRRLAGQPSIVYREYPLQPPAADGFTIGHAQPNWASPSIALTDTTRSCRTTPDFSYVTVPQNVTGEKTFAASTKSARETIDEIKSRFGIKAEAE